MSSYPSFELFLHCLLDVMDTPESTLPERAESQWKPLIDLAGEFKVSPCLADWILREREGWVSANFKHDLEKIVATNNTRNTLYLAQIARTARLFRENGIPALFLKGAAGLLRGLYPPAWRVLSDIDVLVPRESVRDVRQMLARSGYVPNYGQNLPPYYHHIEIHQHQDDVGGLEVHTAPYEPSTVLVTVIDSIWEDAEKLRFHGEEILVPSILDHVWILMRTNTVKNVFLPRLADVVEMSLIVEGGYKIDVEQLLSRAEKEHMPRIVNGMAYACWKYLGMEPFVSVDDPALQKWERWSLAFQRMLYRRTGGFKRELSRSARKRQEAGKAFAAMRFLAGPGTARKIRFGLGMLRYEIRKEMSKLFQ